MADASKQVASLRRATTTLSLATVNAGAAPVSVTANIRETRDGVGEFGGVGGGVWVDETDGGGVRDRDAEAGAGEVDADVDRDGNGGAATAKNPGPVAADHCHVEIPPGITGAPANQTPSVVGAT